MNKGLLTLLALTAILFAVAACSAAPTPTPTQAPLPTATPKPTNTLPPTAALQPTEPPKPTATAVPPTAAPQATATTAQPTAAPATVPPTAIPPTSVPPGLYVTGIRLDPSQPAHAQNISFLVSFLNTANTDQNQKWVVYIYRADNPTKINTQTAATQSTFPPGATDIQAQPPVKFGVTGNVCDYYTAEVNWLDINNKATPFTQPDGQKLTKGFAVCQ
jgi:hypothetical protein